MVRARDTRERDSRRPHEQRPPQALRFEPGGMLALQRSAGNHAVASLLAGRLLVQRAIPAGAKAGQMVKGADGKLYTITKAEFDKDLGEWGYTVEDDTHRFLIPASTRDFGLVEPKEQFLAIDQDANADFSQAVMAADPASSTRS